jgi:hypothetical protein
MGEHRYYDDTRVNQIKKLTAKNKLNVIYCRVLSLAEILAGSVNQVIVAHKNRLCRFAFELVEHIANPYNCSIFVAAVVFAYIVVPILLAWPTMLLWNWLMPSVFGLRTITLWQAMVLNFLSSILLKNSTSSNE